MTAIVGILCQNGVVIGTDSSATFSAGQVRTIEQPMEKLHIAGDRVITVGSGQVGLAQRFQTIVQKSLTDGIFNSTASNIAKHLSKTTVEDFAYTYAPKGEYAALVAFPAEGNFHLCEFAQADFQPEFKTNLLWYVSLGITQHITDSLLALMREVFWQAGPPTVNGGIFVTTWTLDHAVAVNPGGVNSPVRIAILSQDNTGELKAEILNDTVLGEHRQNIAGAKNALREYCEKLERPIDGEVPEIPKPSS